MSDLAILFMHLLTTIAKLMRPGGGRAVVAESLLLKHQLAVLNRDRERAPNLRPIDRIRAGLCTLFYSSVPVAPCRRRVETFHPPRFPRGIGETKIPVTLLSKATQKTRSQGTLTGAYRDHCRDQEAQSELGLPANCTTNLSCVRPGNR